MSLLRPLLCTLALSFSLPTAALAAERIVDSATGRELKLPTLIEELQQADYVLLGERHDNTQHHERRAEIVRALGRRTVVAEQLPHGSQIDFSTAPAQDFTALSSTLNKAGFDAKAWRWPLHQPLFTAIADNGSLLLGGNLPREKVRDIARRGEAAVPADLLSLLAAHPLSAVAREHLDGDLLRGHCGELPSDRLPALRLAQAVRDAAMASTLTTAEGQRPRLLIAGNGHIRRDYGLIRFMPAGQRTLAVGFVEDEAELAEARQFHLYDYVWLTEAANRPDPCAELRKR